VAPEAAGESRGEITLVFHHEQPHTRNATGQ
jgi:hypothetical protein